MELVKTPPGRIDGPAIIAAKHQSYWDIPFLAWCMRKSLNRGFPIFEMGSFHGYPVLRHFVGLFERIGSFAVMRPKDLIRLKRLKDYSKDELTEIMRRTNEDAAVARVETYQRGFTLCFFPEGTRDRRELKRLGSLHEFEDARRHWQETGQDVVILPVAPCIGPRPKRLIPFLVRQPVDIKVMPPIPVSEGEPEELLDRVRTALEQNWTPEPL